MKITEDTFDRFKGCIWGQAIGDALGLGTEFMPLEEVRRNYPNGLRYYDQIVQDAHRSRWPKGIWTDDTEMMLCIANAIIKDKDVHYTSIAQRFKDWFKGNPMGIGAHTHKVLSIGDYVEKPFECAEMIWKLSGKKAAANGGVMRTSVVGLWPWDAIEHAENVCKLTHTDPRCIGSCVIVVELIRNLVYENTLLEPEQVYVLGDAYDPRIREYLDIAFHGTLEELKLDDTAMGYTLKTLAAGVWCLYHAKSFENGLLAIVNMGGDADTNGAVACSLLGARYGDSAIPAIYKELPMYKLSKHFSNSKDDFVNFLRYKNLIKGKQIMLCSAIVQLFDIVNRKIIPNYDLLEKKISKETDKRLKNDKHRDQLGFCHTYWEEMATIAKEKYGIIWLSPAQLNPGVLYD